MKPKDYNKLGEEYTKEDVYLRAKKRLKELKGFYWHLFAYVVINILVGAIHIFNSDGDLGSLRTFSTPLFWGIGLAFHAISVFGKSLFFSKKWEQRKINEFLDKENKRWK